jgi:ribosomal protein S18 acetylase RimI-like enzyme
MEANRAGRDAVEIRRATKLDVPAVIALWAEARSDHASSEDRPEQVERLIEDSPAELLIATWEGEVVGALIAAWDGWRGNLYRLAVREDRRRQGIARSLTEAGEDSLRRRGARRITALVAEDDEDAGGFWEAAGYPVDAEIGRRVRNIPAARDPRARLG